MCCPRSACFYASRLSLENVNTVLDIARATPAPALRPRPLRPSTGGQIAPLTATTDSPVCVLTVPAEIPLPCAFANAPVPPVLW